MRVPSLTLPSLVALTATLLLAGSCARRPLAPEAPAGPPVAAVLEPGPSTETALTWDLTWDGDVATTHPIGRFTALRGWTRGTTEGRWTVGSLAGFAVDVPWAGRWVLELEGRVQIGGADGTSQHVRVTVNRKPYDDLVLTTTESTTTSTHVDLRRGRNVVVLRLDRTASPYELGVSDDRRVLGMLVSKVRLEPSPETSTDVIPPLPSEPTVRQVTAQPDFAALASGARFAAPLRVPDTGRLTLSLTAAGPRMDLPETVELTVQPLGGGRPRTLPRRVAPRDGASTVTLRVPELAGRVAVATVATDAAVRIAVDDLDTPGWTAPTELEPWAAQPDVVVVVLDAMRADALGATRDGRQLTPRLDELGRRSAVFRHAFAPTPYTVASLATIHTGLGFHDHGMVTRDRRLADEATTLAEALSAVGYRTVAVSATPNDSPALGFDQGFETFVAGWTGRSREERLDPFHVTDLAVEQLAAPEDGRPLYLFVHYIHPHEPYAPPERFDVFTDPSYTGSITGRHRTFDKLFRGALVADARDRAHLENLYAGNVLAADAAVGELLDRLAARHRWRDTMIVVTADHGDEFFERGLAGHNRTVYGELLHIPMVVRLPDAQTSGGSVHDRLVTLQDIAPTVARIAGGSMPWPIGAIDLVDPPNDPATVHDRWMVSRTADQERPVFGVRTVGFSTVLYPWGDGELYVLANDPGEVVDLRARRPDLFAGLSVLLQRELWREPFVPAAGDAGPRTEEELEMLRALGYVD